MRRRIKELLVQQRSGTSSPSNNQPSSPTTPNVSPPASTSRRSITRPSSVLSTRTAASTSQSASSVSASTVPSRVLTVQGEEESVRRTAKSPARHTAAQPQVTTSNNIATSNVPERRKGKQEDMAALDGSDGPGGFVPDEKRVDGKHAKDETEGKTLPVLPIGKIAEQKGTVAVQTHAQEQRGQENALAPKTAKPSVTERRMLWVSDFVRYIKEITNENGYFDEPISIDQAETICRYTDSVEKCQITYSSPKLPQATVLELLACKPPDKPFFPHLRLLHIVDSDDLSLYPLFLSQDLEELKMVHVSGNATFECTSFLQALSQTSHSIQTISFLDPTGDHPCPFLIHLPLFQDSLTDLALPFGLPYKHHLQDEHHPLVYGCSEVCPLRLLAVLNQLHKLEKLAISFEAARLCECNLDQSAIAGGIRIFNLKCLALSIAPAYFVRVFGGRQFNITEEFCINLIPGVDDEKVNLPSVMDSFTRVIMVHGLPPSVNLQFGSPRLRCPPSLLNALLTSPRTKQFEARHHDAGIPFNTFTETYYKPGLTFPNLTSISVRYFGEDTPLPLPTLRDLVEMFPNLETLQYLEVKPEVPPDVPVTAERVSVSSRLRTLGICEYKKSRGLPPQKDILAIARWLSGTFPNLTSKNLSVWANVEDEGGAWTSIKEVMSFMEG